MGKFEIDIRASRLDRKIDGYPTLPEVVHINMPTAVGEENSINLWTRA